MATPRPIIYWAAMLTLWALTLAAEVWIQTDITGVRPRADGRGIQAFGTLVFLWSWALAWPVPAPWFRGAMAGSATAAPLILATAWLGQTSPITAGFLLLVGSVVGASLWSD